MKKKTRLLLLAAVGLAAVIVLFVSFYFWNLLNKPYKAYPEARIVVSISSGTSLDSILQTLHNRRVIEHPWVLKAVFGIRGTQSRSKAGVYVFDRALTPLEVYQKLLKGEMVYKVVTVPEGANVFDVETILQNYGLGKAEEFAKALGSGEVLTSLHSIDPAIQSAEGFLFPETYFLTDRDTPQKVILYMIREFRKRYGNAERRRAADLGMSTIEVVSLASLIEKETGQSSERALISGVFHNRLKKSMLLQCDPTVIYAMLLNGEYKGTIRKSDLKLPSPYNTYVSTGLPPGPICNPGEASLRAALYPEQTDKLYFVSKNDGTHYFSATLQEHNRAVYRYQRN